MESNAVRVPDGEQIAALAGVIRASRHRNDVTEAIAKGFDIIAAAMGPCEDCGHPSLDDMGETRTVAELEKIEEAWNQEGELE